ncbi:MAG: hypothetical protein ABSF81_18330, partial [Bacteroidales bacterium]
NFNSSSEGLSKQPKTQPFVAIPYYSWCNRGITQMEVWLPRIGSAVAQPKTGKKITPGFSGNL